MHIPLSERGAAHRSRLVMELRSSLANFHQLDRLKKFVLLGLALMGVIISLATLLYIIEPTDIASAANVPHLAGATATLPSNVPAVTGLYAIQDGVAAAPSLLDLHQYGMSLTGTLTTAACAGSESLSKISEVTGYFLNDGSLSFSISDPSAPQSVTTIANLTPIAGGFAFVHQDEAGHEQHQSWTRTTSDTFSALAVKLCNPE